MKTPLTSIYGSAGTAVALLPSLLWHLSGRGFRMANSGEELLDLFEERYRLPQERVSAKRARCGFLVGSI